jgi:hypothetical protein
MISVRFDNGDLAEKCYVFAFETGSVDEIGVKALQELPDAVYDGSTAIVELHVKSIKLLTFKILKNSTLYSFNVPIEAWKFKLLSLIKMDYLVYKLGCKYTSTSLIFRL